MKHKIILILCANEVKVSVIKKFNQIKNYDYV